MRHQTPTTFEAVGVSIKFENVDEVLFKELGLKLYDGYAIMGHLIRGDTDMVIGPYKINQYIDMYNQLNSLSDDITEVDIWSRQFIISFPPIHCFQSIQFLFRGSEVTVIINMRSCNFKENFLMDMFIGYYCGLTLAQTAEENNKCTIDKIHVIMNIGSLHIFKETLKEAGKLASEKGDMDVLRNA